MPDVIGLQSPTMAAFVLAFECYGARVGVSTNEASIFDLLPKYLPVKSDLISLSAVENKFTLLKGDPASSSGRDGAYCLYDSECLVLSTSDLHVALEQLASELDAVVALEASPSLFVHAGVVGWRGGAIVIPGRSMTGKTSLVMELVRTGATYYSDEYAVFDRQGQIHPFPRPMHLRTGELGRWQKITAESLGSHVGTGALPVALVVATQYDPRARWSPKLLEPGQTVLRLFDNTVDALRRPEDAIDIFARVAAGCVAITGARPSSEQVAPFLLALCAQTTQSRAFAEPSECYSDFNLDPLPTNP
ncbi:MAG: hypothetical protein JO007_09905 [Alphaproteobacteria bacterium]|nr:hypothetical protein [Alphaproteobacteria bacterium]